VGVKVAAPVGLGDAGALLVPQAWIPAETETRARHKKKKPEMGLDLRRFIESSLWFYWC
jgi:hypothetical protein